MGNQLTKKELVNLYNNNNESEVVNNTRNWKNLTQT